MVQVCSLLQNIFCSIYGVKLYKERYTGVWANHLKYLEGTQYLSKDEVDYIQLKLFKNILLNSLRFVPYYKKKLEFSIDDVKSIENIELL